LECGGAPPLSGRDVLKAKAAEHHRTPKRFAQRSIALSLLSLHSLPMSERETAWPHAPTHQLGESGTYFVTAGTYQKEHFFRSSQRLAVLPRGLLTVARDFGWQLEAWAVFSNHYHFIGHSPPNAPDADSLSKMLGVLHTRTSGWVNRLDKTPGRRVGTTSGTQG
jgi:REP element-mobilizing transposase RayT